MKISSIAMESWMCIVVNVVHCMMSLHNTLYHITVFEDSGLRLDWCLLDLAQLYGMCYLVNFPCYPCFLGNFPCYLVNFPCYLGNFLCLQCLEFALFITGPHHFFLCVWLFYAQAAFGPIDLSFVFPTAPGDSSGAARLKNWVLMHRQKQGMVHIEALFDAQSIFWSP